MRTWIGSGICSVLVVGIAAGCGSEGVVTGPGRTDEGFTAPAVAGLVITTDPEGDASASHGSGLPGATYQDIVSAQVDAEGGVFTFAMSLAADVPAAPALPGGITVQAWAWNLNTDPTFPPGYPFAPGSVAPPEFMVEVLWDGTSFTGTLLDRRPALFGAEAVSTPISFDIDGATISATVDADLLDNPSGFSWIARTGDVVQVGSNGLHLFDRAPDSGPALWP